MPKDNIVTLITPFDIDGNIDFNELNNIIKTYNYNYINGILILSDLAESYLLNLEEKIRIVNFVIKNVDKKIKIIVGICEKNLKEIYQFIEFIDSLSFSSYLIYNPIGNDEGLYKFFTRIADKVNHPLILFNDDNIPLNIDLVSELSFHPNIIGIYNCSKGDYIIDLVISCEKNFMIFCDDYNFFSNLVFDIDGVIAGTNNFIGKQIFEIINLYDDDKKSAKEKFLLIYSLISIVKDRKVSELKYLMYLFGFNTNKCRLPFEMPSREIKRMIELTVIKYFDKI